jgi:tetratricopeptide (TPR) repeat protein
MAHSEDLQSLWGLVRACDAQGNAEAAIVPLCRLAVLLPDSMAVLEALSARCHTAQQLPFAIEAYASYLLRNPHSAIGQYNYGYLLSRAGDAADAIVAYKKAIELQAERPEEIELNIATAYAEQLRDDVASERHLQQALMLNPGYVPAHFNLGCLAEQQGDREKATALFSHCLALDPHYEPALARLVDAQGFRDEQSPLLIQLRQRAATSHDPDLHFALARALEQCGNFSAALTHYDFANRVDKASYEAYDASQVVANFDAIKSCFTSDWLSKRQQGDGSAPVFICGMFRSGSTLLEQILAAHSAFTPAGEREFFARLVAKELPDYPVGCEAISAAQVQEWATQYQIESTRVFGPHLRLTDKRPDNFLYLGLIKALFPSAKILVTQRAWRDIAWSIYATRFGPGQHYATDLGSIKHMIAQQQDLMRHWQSLFPEDIQVVDYESVVTSPRETIAAVLEFLAEPWEEACLSFSTLKNTVRTESVWQVRQPLYTSSIGRSAPFVALCPDAFE